jgi:tetratricopeptide (TPR) repeat protein
MRILAALAFTSALSHAAWVELRAPTGPFVVLTENTDAGRLALNHLEQFRYALGQSIGQQELKSVWPIVIVVARPSKGIPSPSLALARGAFVSSFPIGSAPPREWWRGLGQVLLDGSLAGRMPPGFEDALGILYSTLEVKGPRLTVGLPPPPSERTPAWALIHMLATSPETSGRIRVLLSNLAQGADSDPAFRNAFEQPEAELIAKAGDYLKAGVFNTIPVSGRALDPDRFKLIPASPAQVKLIPGDLLFAAKSPAAEIRAAYQSAVEQGAIAGGHEGLGFLDDPAEFKEAVRVEGASARAWLEYGRQLKDPTQALAAFEKAIQLNPNWSEPHFRIAEISDAPGKKVFALRKAVAADPRNMAYWRAYAEALESQKNYVEAVKAWRGAERAAPSEAERQELRRIAQQRGDLRAEQEAAERRRKAEEERAEVERLRLEAVERIRAAESKANQQTGAVKEPSKVEKWWDGPPLTKVSGTLVRVDCLGRQARLVLQTADAKPLQLLIVDPAQIVVMGGGEKTFGCGPQKPPRNVKVEYVPKPNAKLGTAGEAQVVEFP